MDLVVDKSDLPGTTAIKTEDHQQIGRIDIFTSYLLDCYRCDDFFSIPLCYAFWFLYIHPISNLPNMRVSKLF